MPLPRRRIALACRVVVWTPLLTAQVALCAEAAAEGGRTVTDSGTIYNALWAMGIFAALMVILRRFAWGPILKAIEQRERMVADTIQQARQQQVESEKLLAQYKQKLDQADTEAAQRLEQARRAAAEARDQILAAARAQADDVTKRASQEIHAAKQQALEELYAYAADLATEVAGKIIRRQLSPVDQRRLVEEALADIRQQAQASPAGTTAWKPGQGSRR